MDIERFAYLECIRKPVKNVILCIIFIIIFSGTLVGLRIYSSTQQARDDALNTIGAYIQLSENYSEKVEQVQISEEMIDKVQTVQHVIGVNQNLAEYAIPVNFINVKQYSGETPDPDDLSYLEAYDITPDNVVVDANLDNQFLDIFRLNQARLLEGTIPNNANRGLMIEKHLAEINGSSIGDFLRLTSSKGIEVKAEIIGIYEIDAVFQITKNNTLGEGIFSLSPYNRIYASLDIGMSLYDRDPSQLILNIIVDHPDNVTKVGKTIKSFNFDWEQYGLYNMTETFYQDYARHIDELGNYAKLLLFYILTIGAVFLSIVLTIFSGYYKYDSGILLSLGAPKSSIVFQYFLSTAYIIVFSLIVSAIIVYSVGNSIVQVMINQTGMVSIGIAQFNNGLNGDFSVHIQSLGLRGLLLFIGTVFFFLVLSCASPTYQILKFKPREILADKRR